MYVSASRFPGAVAWGAPQAVCKVSLAPEAGVTEPCAAAVDTYYAGRTQFMQEPIFVPRPGAQASDSWRRQAGVWRRAARHELPRQRGP